MKRKIHLPFILLMISTTFSQENKYCKLGSCPNGSHTLCKIRTFRFGYKCQRPIMSQIPVNQIKHIVNFHNYLRYPDLYNEPENFGPQPALISLGSVPYLLEWDEELAFIAQRWANQCENTVDECRNIAKCIVTQRVDVREALAHEARPTVFKSIRWWYNHENLDTVNVQKLKSEALNSTSRKGKAIMIDESSNSGESSNRGEISSMRETSSIPQTSLSGQLLSRDSTFKLNQNQMVWGNANKIGCGLIRTYDYSKHMLYFVCNYGYINETREQRKTPFEFYPLKAFYRFLKF